MATLSLPVPGVTQGPLYAQMLNAALNAINTDTDVIRRGTRTLGNVSGVPFIELISNTGSQATLHLSSGNGFSGPYLFGLGNDFGDRPGFLIANKAAGQGLYLDNQPTATNTGFFGAQRSNAALVDLVAAKSGSNGTFVLRVLSGITPTLNQALLAVYSAGDAEVFKVTADGKVGVFGKAAERQARIDYVTSDNLTPTAFQDRINRVIATLINYGWIPE